VLVEKDWRYHVDFENGLCARFGKTLRDRLGLAEVVVLTDRRVHRVHGSTFLGSLREAGFSPRTIVIPPGERSKSVPRFTRVLDRLTRMECDRRTLLVNFGGGVVSDLEGFAASAYMRGIPYVNFATSLLGQIDACVGGKVAVNSPVAKNLIGAFYHPRYVAGDPELLRSLASRDYRSGLAEGIKVAIIDSPDLFRFLETHREEIASRDPGIMLHVVHEATRLKMDRVSLDPYEEDLRRPLNFGHTIGHPIETEFSYKDVRHGEAVAIGMGVATAISVDQGEISGAESERIFDMLDAHGLLGLDEPIRPDSIVAHVRYVRLIRGGKLNFVLPRAIGDVRMCDDIEDAALVRGIERYETIVRERRT